MFVKSVLVASVGAAIIMEAKKPNCSKFICNNWKVAFCCWFYIDTSLTYGFESFRNAGLKKRTV